MTPIDVVAEALEAHGRIVKRRGDRLEAQCPAHEDSSPSLSVVVGNKRDVAIKCHAGCSADDVMAALGLRWTDLGPKVNGRQLHQVAAYRYDDADGKHLFDVVRFEPKTFRQRRPDGSWGLGDTPRVLYHLPEVLAAEEVWVVEGEKDADRLRAEGLTATCNPMGAGMFKLDHACVLAGKRVRVIADRDDAGRAHAATVEYQCKIAGVASVVMLEPAEGKDVSDHLAAGLGLDELVVIDDAAFTVKAVDDWPPAEPLEGTMILPTFPVEALPEWVGTFALAVAERLQVPVDLCCQQALGALAAIAMTHAKVTVNGTWTEPLNIFVCTALPSGAGKSPADKQMTGPLRELEAEWIEQTRPIIAKQEQLREVLRKKAKRLETMVVDGKVDPVDWLDAVAEVDLCEVPPDPRLLVDDVTPEALVQLLQRHGGRLALVSTESEMFDQACGTYARGGRVNLSVYLKGHSGETIRVDRVGGDGRPGRNLEVPSAHLTAALTVQPSALASLAKVPELAGRGFTARFMYAMPGDLRGHRDQSTILDIAPIDGTQRYRDAFMDLGRRLASWQVAPVIPLCPDALHTFVGWVSDMEPQLGDGGDFEPVAEWAAKLKSTVVRLAGLLHLAEGGGGGKNDCIALDVIQRAIVVGEYWMAHAMAVAGLWGRDDTHRAALVVWRWLDRTRPVTFEPRDVQQNVTIGGKRLDVTTVRDALGLLIDHGWVRWVKVERSRNGKELATGATRPDWRPSQLHQLHQLPKDRVKELGLSIHPPAHTPAPTTGATSATGGSGPNVTTDSGGVPPPTWEEL